LNKKQREGNNRCNIKKAKEATTKQLEEERQKKDIETRNDDAQVMDIDIPEISTIGASGHTPFNGLGLGLCTPFRPSEVPNLNKFTYDKVSGKIVQEQVKKVPVTGGNPISVLTQTPIIGNVSEDLVTIASTGSSFMNST
jgi:hypothetical protein